MYKALMPYFGGKRKLANQILKYAEGETFIDGFLGGGSVSLLAKARGFQVISNDKADRSAILGQALINNDEVYIEEEDIVRLFVLNDAGNNFIRDNHPKQFTIELANFLDNARANIEQIKDPVKRAVVLFLWIRIIMYYRPVASFSHINAVEHVISEEENVTDTIQKLRERYSRPIYDVIRELAAEVNEGIFSNGKANEVYQQDVFEFLKHVQGDTIYLDPPYYGAESYEQHYKVLDSIIAGEMISKADHSDFNTRQVITVTAKLLEACNHIPTIIMSVGRRIIDKEQYIKLLKEYRKNVIDIPVEHQHSYGSGDHIETGKQEVLLVGRAA
jgi:adenine-specific DNA methylase